MKHFLHKVRNIKLHYLLLPTNSRPIFPVWLLLENVGFLIACTQVILDEIDENGVPRRLMFETSSKAFHHHIYVFNLHFYLPSRALNLLREFASFFVYRSEEELEIFDPPIRPWIEAFIAVHAHVSSIPRSITRHASNDLLYCIEQVGIQLTLDLTMSVGEVCEHLDSIDDALDEAPYRYSRRCPWCKSYLKKNYPLFLNAYGGVMVMVTLCTNSGRCYYMNSDVLDLACDSRLMKRMGTFLRSKGLEGSVQCPIVDVVEQVTYVGMVQEEVLHHPPHIEAVAALNE
jgi:hypothetical protein